MKKGPDTGPWINFRTVHSRLGSVIICTAYTRAKNVKKSNNKNIYKKKKRKTPYNSLLLNEHGDDVSIVRVYDARIPQAATSFRKLQDLSGCLSNTEQ